MQTLHLRFWLYTILLEQLHCQKLEISCRQLEYESHVHPEQTAQRLEQEQVKMYSPSLIVLRNLHDFFKSCIKTLGLETNADKSTYSFVLDILKRWRFEKAFLRV